MPDRHFLWSRGRRVPRSYRNPGMLAWRLLPGHVVYVPSSPESSRAYGANKWIVLVLKPGGLIPSTYGKLIMMAVFSLVVFSLAFHRHTKPYALIFATSFSGATSIVLGIDCFSRAGLKEFWLYIWGMFEVLILLRSHITDWSTLKALTTRRSPSTPIRILTHAV